MRTSLFQLTLESVQHEVQREAKFIEDRAVRRQIHARLRLTQLSPVVHRTQVLRVQSACLGVQTR